MAELFLDQNKCLKDGICIEVCPCKIFAADDNSLAHIQQNLAPACVGCGHCVAICPGNAISLDKIDGGGLETIAAPLPELEKFLGLVQARRSIRSYRAEKVPTEVLVELLETTRWAPTAKNTQTHSWILLNGRENVLKLSQAVIDSFRGDEKMAGMVASFDAGYDIIHRGAPHVVVAYGPKKYKWGVFDAATALNTLELAARTRGLGTCWAGFTTWAATLDNAIGKSIGLNEDDQIYAALMLGRPSFSYKRIPLRQKLKLKIIE